MGEVALVDDQLLHLRCGDLKKDCLHIIWGYKEPGSILPSGLKFTYSIYALLTSLLMKDWKYSDQFILSV